MGWVINTIAKLILRAICQLFSVLAEDFIKYFGINIGANFPAVKGKNMSIATVLNSYGNDKLTSTFDVLFNMQAFKHIIVGMAITIAIGLLVIELMKAMAAPITHGRKQHPATTVAKFALLAIPGVILSYRIFICMEFIGNEFYRTLGAAAIDGMKPSAGKLQDFFIESETKNNVFNVLYYAGSGAGAAGEVAFGAAPITGIAAIVFNLIIIWILFSNFLRLMIEIMERYIVLGLLFYTAPLPFATLASDETNHIFSSWLKMTLSQMLLMITNGMFVSVFIAALLKVSKGTNSAILTGRLSWALYMLLLVGWLLMAQRFDSYLKSLGLATAQTGGGLAASVRSGIAAVGGVAASMGMAYKNSDLRKNLKNAPVLGKDKRELGNTKAGLQAKAIGNAAQTGFNKITGKSNDGVLNSQRNQNQLRELSQAMQKNGAREEGRLLSKKGMLEGDEAKKGLLASTQNKALQKEIQNAADAKIGLNANGQQSFSLETKDGRYIEGLFGENAKNGLSVGKIAGMDTSITGEQSVLDRIGSDGGRSLTQNAADAYAKVSGGQFAAVSLSDGGVGVKNMNTGQAQRIALAGATDVSGSHLGTFSGQHFVEASVPAEMAKSAVPFNQSQRIQANQSALYQCADKSGYELGWISNPGQLTPSESGSFLDMMGYQTGLSDLFRDSIITNNGDGILDIQTPNHGHLKINMFNDNANGASLTNNAGIPCKIECAEQGTEEGLLNILYAANPGIGKEANSLKTFFENVAGGSQDIAVEDYVGSGYRDIYIKGDNGDKINLAKVTSSSIAPVLDGEWNYHGNYASMITPEGYEWYKEKTGMDVDWNNIV